MSDPILDPSDRHLLTEALRPPAGFELDRAVATTFTLGLDSLLTAFLMLRSGDADDLRRVDPAEILAALRRQQDRVTVFCHGGGIHAPSNYRTLHCFLEDGVVQVLPHQQTATFHPKIWALRFRAAVDPTVVRHRFVCLSRNLTADHSWDTVLATDELDRDSEDRIDPGPLADFLEDLLDLPGAGELTAGRAAGLRDLAASIRASRGFELPGGFTAGELVPLGVPSAAGWTPGERLQGTKAWAVISPFIDSATLAELPAAPDPCHVVTRPEMFDQLAPAAIPDGSSRLVLRSDAMDEDGAGDPDDRPDGEAERHSGLHAKVILWEVQGKGCMLTGSANVTHPAFHSNVEFSVQLTGRFRMPYGQFVPDMLGRDAPLRAILEDYEPTPEAREEARLALVDQEAERQIGRFHARLALAAPVLALAEEATGDGGPAYRLTLDLGGHELDPPADSRTTVTPASLTDAGEQPLADGVSWRMEALGQVTSWLRVTTESPGSAGPVVVTAVVKARLEGAPADRQDRLAATELNKSANAFLRYLANLLEDPDVSGQIGWESDDAPWGDPVPGARGTQEEDIALVEPLLRAAALDPSRLEFLLGEYRRLEPHMDGALAQDLRDVMSAFAQEAQQ